MTSKFHERLTFEMPARCDIVFDAFHFHHWRAQWDSLVAETIVVGGYDCPFVGAISVNRARGLFRVLSMTTEFVSFDRPRVAAAKMVGRTFPFQSWAAGMQHKAIDANKSLLIYSYNYELGSSVISRCLAPFVRRSFAYQTRLRFTQLQSFLYGHAESIARWQQHKNCQPCNQ